MKKVMGEVAVAICGAALIKLYGDYRYYCGKVDAGDFYIPIIDTMGDHIKILCNKLKEKEGEA